MRRPRAGGTRGMAMCATTGLRPRPRLMWSTISVLVSGSTSTASLVCSPATIRCGSIWVRVARPISTSGDWISYSGCEELGTEAANIRYEAVIKQCEVKGGSKYAICNGVDGGNRYGVSVYWGRLGPAEAD